MVVTLEVDLGSLRTELQGLKDQKAQIHSEPDLNESHRPLPSTNVSILTHKDRLTELGRLDMIAQRWRKDLELAQFEHKKHEYALEETEDQVASASQELIELQPPKTPRKGRSTSAASSTGTEGSTSPSSENSPESSQQVPAF